MRIAILGTGQVAAAAGLRWAQRGHDVVYGARDPGDDRSRELLARGGERVCVGSVAEAAQAASIVLLAVPWSAIEEVLGACGDLTGKTLVDCINPVRPDLSGLDLRGSPSAAERIAALAPTARVVKAFNAVSVKAMENPSFQGERATLFYCGDDRESKELVRRLAEDLDFDAVDGGPLRNAAYLEALAMEYIHLAVAEGWDFAFKLIRR